METEQAATSGGPSDRGLNLDTSNGIDLNLSPQPIAVMIKNVWDFERRGAIKMQDHHVRLMV